MSDDADIQLIDFAGTKKTKKKKTTGGEKKKAKTGKFTP